MSDQPPTPMNEMAALKVPFEIGPENLSSNPAAHLVHFFNFDNCFALGDLTKVQVQVKAGRSVKVKHELHLTGRCRIMSVCPDAHGNQHVSALDATIRDGAAHIDAQHPATLMSLTISPSGSIVDLSIGNPRQVSHTPYIAGGVAHGGGFIAKFESKPFQGTPTLDMGFAQADLDRIRDIEKLLENLKRADVNLRDATKRLESAGTALAAFVAAFQKMPPDQKSTKEPVIAQKKQMVSDAERDIAQIQEIRRDNNEHQLTAERLAILSKAPQSVACTMFEKGEITWSGTHWVRPTIVLHQPHFVVDNTHGRTITRYGKHVNIVSQESGFDRIVTYGHNLFVRRDFPRQQIKTDVTMDRSTPPSHERPTEAMYKEATFFEPLLVHAEAVFKRDDVPFLEMIAEHRIPADCTPQQLSDHLTFIDAHWNALAMRPLPPAHHSHSSSSFWKSKAASPSSSALVKNLAKRQLLDKLLKLPDVDAGRQRPISLCASTGPLALRCTPQQCRGDPMFCPANRAVSLTFTYPNHATDLRAQFDLRHELLRASSAAQASATQASAAQASAAKPKSAKRASVPAAAAAAEPAAPAAPAASRKRSASPKPASKRPKQGGSRTRRRLRR